MHMSNGYASPSDERPIVVKYGGNALPKGGEIDEVLGEVAEMWSSGVRIVLVHGGGPEIDRALEQRGIPTRRVEGLRVTDAPTLDVTEAVLCGTLNKRLVRACAALGVRAVGVSGEDGGMLVAERAAGPGGFDLGYVGEIVACDATLLRSLLGDGWMPVVAPLAAAADASHAYNVNADLAAAAIAGALRARAFVAVTNVPRVYADPDDPSTAIDRISLEAARAFLQSEGCRDSMKPKMQAAIAALESGADASYICAAGKRTIRAALYEGAATVVSRVLNGA
jgi:acetylglutamate kinase